MTDEENAYRMGYDSQMNGANTVNCHFSLFSTPESTRAWEMGNFQAKEDRKLLSPIERELLNYLVQNPGYHDPNKIPIIGLEDKNSVAVNVCRIRKKIGDERIENLRGFGYRCVPALAEERAG